MKNPPDKIQSLKPKNQNKNISPARVAAFEILYKIEIEKAFSSVLLPNYEAKLESKDRALCHELTLGILRKQLYLDKIIERISDKKPSKIDRPVLIALRLGLYQLFFLDKIPPYSAINDSVNLVQRAKKTSAKGFVNAILRKAAREKINPIYSDENEKISVETSHPIWLIEKWIKEFGLEETAKLAAANNETPKLAFRFTAKTSEAVKTSLKKQDIEDEKKYLRDLAESGKIYFQDEASQLVAEVVNLQAEESFLDVCCAPGSKFSMVNYLAGQNKKLFVGGDLYFQRLKIVEKICKSVGANDYDILEYDAEKSLPFADESFDVVLLDAPCSGTGTIRHNPELRYFLNSKDFSDLSNKQLQILTNASKVLKRGGRLIYSTCSLELEENEQVIENFLEENKNFQTGQLKLPQQFLGENGYARTFPQRHQLDGFFIALLEKY